MTTKKEYKNTEIKQKSNQEVAKFGSPFHITRIEGGLDTPSPPLDPPLSRTMKMFPQGAS